VAVSQNRKAGASPLVKGLLMSDIDYIEVSRVAHELEHSHGLNAWQYAEQQAEKFEREGDIPMMNFWSAVAASLRPRN
jgi:hypothetical protein